MPAPERQPRPHFLDRLCEVLAALLILAQLGGVVRSRFTDDSFFSWAPHDQRTDFRIEATWRGEPVPGKQIWKRYSLAPRGTDWHAWGDPLSVIQVAESRLPPEQRWEILVRYRVNTGPEQVFRWPEVAP